MDWFEELLPMLTSMGGSMNSSGGGGMMSMLDPMKLLGGGQQQQQQASPTIIPPPRMYMPQQDTNLGMTPLVAQMMLNYPWGQRPSLGQ